MQNKVLLVLQAIMIILGIAKFLVLLYMGVVEPFTMLEFVHSILEVNRYFKK